MSQDCPHCGGSGKILYWSHHERLCELMNALEILGNIYPHHSYVLFQASETLRRMEEVITHGDLLVDEINSKGRHTAWRGLFQSLNTLHNWMLFVMKKANKDGAIPPINPVNPMKIKETTDG